MTGAESDSPALLVYLDLKVIQERKRGIKFMMLVNSKVLGGRVAEISGNPAFLFLGEEVNKCRIKRRVKCGLKE
jgi:hypothetical protein